MGKRIIPSRYIRIDDSAGTVAIRNLRTGRFRGRRKVSGKGDSTQVIRITRDFDIDGDGKKDPTGGLIFGRTTKVKSSSRGRSHLRRTL